MVTQPPIQVKLKNVPRMLVMPKRLVQDRRKNSMSIEISRTAYYESSGTLSELVRKLAYTGIAIIWIFKTGDNLSFVIPQDLLWGMYFCGATLFFDVFQYAWKTIIFGYWHRKLEKIPDKNKPNKHPRWFNWPTIFFLWAKFALVLNGYYYLVVFFIKSLNTK